MLTISIISFCLIFGVSISCFANTNSVPQTTAQVFSTMAKRVPPQAFNSVQKNELQYVSKQLTQHNLPQELAVIPIIESHYNTHAVSSKGAGGLWQLMPATARQFGIKSRQRFQLQPSTAAALSYFAKLHKKFGNWEFAIAAYNAGDGRVEKALQHNPTATSVQQLNLPRETKQYVQKFYRAQTELKSYLA